MEYCNTEATKDSHHLQKKTKIESKYKTEIETTSANLKKKTF